MSTPTGATFEEIRPREEFQVSPNVLPTSGFLTPSSPYNLETRRDSIASSHTSMSFGSCVSEYSQPVTPTWGQSPMPSRGFPGVITYDLGPEIQNQSFHGLPMTQEPKAFATNENMYNPWMLGAHNTEMCPPISTHASHVLPHTEDLFQTYPTDSVDLDVPLIPSVNPSWASTSAVVHSDVNQQWSTHGFSPTITEGEVQTFWADQFHSGQGAHEMTIVPAIAGMGNDYVRDASNSFTEADSFEDLGPSSPQEVSFKKETSPPSVKHELVAEEEDDADDDVRLTRSIYVSPTGGKSVVKKERKMYSGVAKARKNRNAKAEPGEPVNLKGMKATLKHDGVVCEWDQGAARVKFRRTRDGQPRQQCSLCPRQFRRMEHLARHEKTHNGEKPYGCPMCKRFFNRNDNCVAHLITHVRKPNKKAGRNQKMPLEEVQDYFPDQKMKDKIRHMYLKDITPKGH
ncbi:hypothetical protein N0V90_011871 [Kalmusia sp. IMI 367209]|nr:hypothetical protein N0V90_011871 [Kalmusia sp. IMI 367209]